MRSFFYRAGRIVLCCLAAMVVIAAIQLVSSLVYPLPAGLELRDQEALARHIATLPMGAFLFVLASYLLGTVLGTWLVGWWSPRESPANSLIVGFILLLAGASNLFTIPHPVWFAVASVLMFPIASSAGIWMSCSSRQPASTANDVVS